jgi:hypothetical protein
MTLGNRIREPRRELLNSLARWLGTSTEDLLRAAGYIPQGGTPSPLDAVLKELEVIQPMAIPIFDQEHQGDQGQRGLLSAAGGGWR